MIRRHFPVTRAQAVQRVKAQLRRGSFPRLQMMLLVSLTGGFGLIWLWLHSKSKDFLDAADPSALSPSGGRAPEPVERSSGVTALFLAAVGAGLSAHAPGAKTVGQAMARVPDEESAR